MSAHRMQNLTLVIPICDGGASHGFYQVAIDLPKMLIHHDGLEICLLGSWGKAYNSQQYPDF